MRGGRGDVMMVNGEEETGRRRWRKGVRLVVLMMMVVVVAIAVITCANVVTGVRAEEESEGEFGDTNTHGEDDDAEISEEAAIDESIRQKKINAGFSANSNVRLTSDLERLQILLDQVRKPAVEDEEAMKKQIGSLKFAKMMQDANDPKQARTNPDAICFMLLFFTSTCGACTEMISYYDQAASEVMHLANAEGQHHPLARVVMIAVDATDPEVAKDVKREFGVTQFPTMQWWRGGFYSGDYTGPEVTESADIVDWIIYRMLATSIGLEELDSVSAAEEFIENTNDDNEVAVIGFMDDPKGGFGAQFAYKSFQRFAVDVDKMRLGVAKGRGSGGLSRMLGGNDRPPHVMAFRNVKKDFLGEEAKIEYDGPILEQQMRAWLLHEATTPRLFNFFDEYYQYRLLGAKPLEQELLGLVFTAARMPTKLAKAMVAVDEELYPAIDFRAASVDPYKSLRDLRFVRVENVDTDPEGASMRNFYGVPTSELPALVFINITDPESRRWKYGNLSGKVDIDDVASFARGVISGEIEPSERGEAPSEAPVDEDAIVQVAIRDTWSELVTEQDTDDVLVLLHIEVGEASAPMMSAFDSLGRLLKDQGVENLRLVSCDVLNNAIPDLGSEFAFTPAVFFFPPRSVREKIAETSEVEDETGISMYHGGPDINSLLSFLRAKVTVAKVPDVEAYCADTGTDGGASDGTTNDGDVAGATNNSTSEIPLRDSSAATAAASSAIGATGNGLNAGHSEL